MRASRFHIATTKETPNDAEIASHRLMLRAGLVRRVGSGLYTWMPVGLRTVRKIEAIVRREMSAAGALELIMPACCCHVRTVVIEERAGSLPSAGATLRLLP